MVPQSVRGTWVTVVVRPRNLFLRVLSQLKWRRWRRPLKSVSRRLNPLILMSQRFRQCRRDGRRRFQICWPRVAAFAFVPSPRGSTLRVILPFPPNLSVNVRTFYVTVKRIVLTGIN